MSHGLCSNRSLAPGPMADSPRTDYLRVTPRGGTTRTRKLYHLHGLDNHVDFRVHNSSIVNLERAIKERVFNVVGPMGFTLPPRPDSALFSKRMSTITKLIVRQLRPTTPVSHDAFVGLYKDRRKEVYRKAAESLLSEPLCRWDARLVAFVKAEKINFSTKKDPAPRVIQPRTPRYNVELGCYLKPIEHRLYGIVADIFGTPTIMKGYNAKQVGQICSDKWNSFRKPVAIGLDASRFDQHVHKQALEWEHSIYLSIFKKDQKLAKLLRWQIENRGFGYCNDGKLKYSKVGCRMSGDMNTALGNCLLMCAMIYAHMESLCITRFELLNNGDDCIVIIEQDMLETYMPSVQSFFLELGFTMKVEKPVFEIEHIDFCQTHPVFDGEGYTMVRDPRTSVSKDCTSIHPLDSKGAFSKYLTVFGKGGLSLTTGIPMWQAFYSSLLRSGESNHVRKASKNRIVLETGMAMLSRGMVGTGRRIEPESRESFRVAFGIDPDMQVAMENHFEQTVLKYCRSPPILEGDFDFQPFTDWPL